MRVKAIYTFRDKNNHITGYRLRDKSGATMDIETPRLKELIINHSIEVANLKLTSDGRLICKDKNVNRPNTVVLTPNIIRHIDDNIPLRLNWVFKCVKNYTNAITKAKLLGYKEFTVSNNITALYDETQCMIMINADKCCMNTVASGMFSGIGARSLDLREIDTSKVVIMSSMFYQCTFLETINISTWDTHNVKDMHRMITFCSNIREVDMRNLDTSNVRTMAYMLEGNNRLVKAVFGKNDTHNLQTMEAMFMGCTALKYVDISGLDTSNVTTVESMFFGCDSIDK